MTSLIASHKLFLSLRGLPNLSSSFADAGARNSAAAERTEISAAED